MVEVLGRCPAAAGAQKTHRAAGSASCRTRGEAQRMPDTPGSLIRRAAAAACLLIAAAGRAAAQSPAPAPDKIDFLSRAEYHLAGNVLAIENDQRFSFDGFYGGDADLFDYVKGRLQVLAD